MRRILAIKTSLLLVTVAAISVAARPTPKSPVSIDYVRSKMGVNKTTLDSIKVYFGKPLQKKFHQHIDYIFDKMDNGLPGSLSINFYDNEVKSSSIVKSWILTQPGKEPISEGIQ